jgi:hypothetical protein
MEGVTLEDVFVAVIGVDKALQGDRSAFSGAVKKGGGTDNK